MPQLSDMLLNVLLPTTLSKVQFCRGAVLILGGIMLNVWAAALLFQPVEEHMVRQYKPVEDEEEVAQVRFFYFYFFLYRR